MQNFPGFQFSSCPKICWIPKWQKKPLSQYPNKPRFPRFSLDLEMSKLIIIVSETKLLLGVSMEPPNVKRVDFPRSSSFYAYLAGFLEMSKRFALFFRESNVNYVFHNSLRVPSYFGGLPKVSLELKFSWGLPGRSPQLVQYFFKNFFFQFFSLWSCFNHLSILWEDGNGVSEEGEAFFKIFKFAIFALNLI